MRTFLIAALTIGGVVYTDLNAQRGGARGGGGAAVRPGGTSKGMPAGRMGDGWNRGWNNRFGQRGLGYGWGYGANGFGYPAFYSDSGWPATYGDGYGDGIQTSPSVVLVMPQAPPEPPPPPPPPEPARPVTHEYTWADAGADSHATFSIVSRDGLVRRAVAVWVQDNSVGYTAADGSSGRLPQASVDCGTTNRLNAENKLRLSLPGCKLSQ